MQLQRRTLWVAKNGGCSSTLCSATGCVQEENQLHLIECPFMKRDFWNYVEDFMQRLKMEPENETIYWLAGQRANGKMANPEEISIIMWAWRSLYAATVRSHIEEIPLKLERARFDVAKYTLSRAQAYGQKWSLWYRRQRGHTHAKYFPFQHRNNRLINFDEFGHYELNDILKPEFCTLCSNS